MSIIYSYPTKGSPVGNDKVLITDSESTGPANQTKQVTITALAGLGAAGVPTFSGGTTGLTPATATSGAITLGGTLETSNGGTGKTTAGTHDILVGRNSKWEPSSGVTTAIQLPRGTTGEAPAEPVNGMMRYDNTTNKLMAYVGGAWVSIDTT